MGAAREGGDLRRQREEARGLARVLPVLHEIMAVERSVRRSGILVFARHCPSLVTLFRQVRFQPRVERRNGCRFGRRSEEHTSELQSLMRISYAVFCLKKKTKASRTRTNRQLTTVTIIQHQNSKWI